MLAIRESKMIVKITESVLSMLYDLFYALCSCAVFLPPIYVISVTNISCCPSYQQIKGLWGSP